MEIRKREMQENQRKAERREKKQLTNKMNEKKEGK